MCQALGKLAASDTMVSKIDKVHALRELHSNGKEEQNT